MTEYRYGMSDTEIVTIETIPVSLPLRPDSEPGGVAPYIGNAERLTETKRLIVRLELACGVTGWGEMWPEAAYGTRATDTILREEIAPQIIGMEAWETESVTELFEREYVDARAFVGAIEMAMWDAYGTYLDVPLYELLGGKTTDYVPFAYLVGIFDEDRSRMHVRRAIDRGFDVLKVKGSADWKNDVRRLKAMHDEADGRLDFRLDPNQGWSPEDAVRALATLEDNGIYLQYIEQPIRVDTPETLVTLRNRVRTPIAINEDTYRPRSLSKLCQRGAIDAAVVDLVPSGGITALRRLAGVAMEFDVSLAHHNAFDLGIKTAAITHVVASTPGFTAASDTVYDGIADDIIENPLSVTDGTISIPDGAGLGVSVDETKLSKYRIDE